MAFFNYAAKEITLKVVYYGPGLSGKTTNLQNLYATLNPAQRGKFISLPTESDRTLFFDFLPVNLGMIKNFSIRLQLYTVPGQIRYNATRKLVLKGVDAIVFVADSQKQMRAQNIESFESMGENLLSNNINQDTIPVVLQYNKRDLMEVLSIEELNNDLNKKNYQCIEAEAINGKGVQETFQTITKLLLEDISIKHQVEITPTGEKDLLWGRADGARVSQKKQAKNQKEAAGSKENHEVPLTAEATAADQTKIKRSMHYDEKLNSVVESLYCMNQALSGISDKLSIISSENAEAGKIRSDMLIALKEISDKLSAISSENVESEKTRESMLDALKDVSELLKE